MIRRRLKLRFRFRLIRLRRQTNQEHEEDEEHVGDEERRSEHSVGSFERVEVEVAENGAEKGEYGRVEGRVVADLGEVDG